MSFKKKAGILRTSFSRIFHDDLQLFLQNSDLAEANWTKQFRTRNHFVKKSVKGLKMTLTCWIWTMLTTVDFVGHLLHFLSLKIWPPNVELSFCQVDCPCQNLSCIAAASKELILWQSTLRWFFVGYCIVNRLVSKESPRPAVYTTWKIWKKTVKHNFGMKNKIGHFFEPPCIMLE